MPDIFDTVADEPKPDIFDQVSEGETISEARPSLLQRLRTSPLGRSILGPTDIEKQAMAGGVSGSQLGVAEIPEAMLKMTSIGLPPVRKAVEATQKFIEENPEATQLLAPGIGTALGGLARSKFGRGVERGVEEFALDVPTAPLPGISKGKAALTALGVFGAQYLSDQPEVYQQFKTAVQNGDVESATKIAVQNGLGALLLAFGAKHGINEIKAPLEREVQNAETIRSNQGQPVEPGQVAERSEANRGGDLQQEPPGPPNVAARQVAQAPQEAQVALPENIAQRRDALQALQNSGKSTPEQDVMLAQLKATETVNKAKQKAIADELKAQLPANALKEAPVVEQPVKSAGEQTAPPPAEAEPTVESVTPLEVQSGNVKPPPIPKPIGLGAAIPEEFKPAGATATSIKNATVDAERQQRGLPAMMGQAKRSFGTVWDTAMSVIDSDPGIQDRLIGELKNKPRSLTDLEDALLLHRRVDLRNEYAKATRDLAQAYDDGRQDAVTENMARVADWGDKLQELENVTKAGGRETARGLNARKMMANEDFTLAQMALDKRAAKGGGPLSQSETLEIQKIHDDYRKRIAELEQHLSERDQQLAELSSQQAFKDMQSEVRKETGRKRTEGTPESVSLKISEDAKSGDLGSLSTSIQKLARMFVEQGIKTRDALIDAVHDVVKDVLPNVTRREIMDAISGYGKFKQLTKDEISVQLRDLKGQMQQIGKLEDMASGVAPQKTGVERRTPSDEERRLIKQVEEAKRRGGYKVTDPATQLRTRLQAAKTAIQNQIKDLEFEIAKKERILKTKTEMVPDKELLDLRAKRDALKAEHKSIFGERVISEAQKLKMAESAIDRQISDLQDQLRTGEIFPPSKPEKPALTSAAIESKLQTLSELKLRRYYERQRIQPSVVPEIQEANRIAAQMKSVKTRLTNQIADLEHQIKTRQKIVREKRGIEYDAEAEKLRARRDELKKQFDEIFVRPEMTDAQRLQLWKNRTTNRIAELQAKLDAGDFTRKPKHPPVVLDNEAVKLQASVERLKKSWNEGLRKDELSRRNRWQKGLDAFVKWERAFKLSSPVVFGKLTAAAMTRLVTTGTEELVGGGLSQLPGLRRVAAQAPREGGLNVKAMAKGVTEGITKGMKDAWDTARTGGADIDVTFGDKIRDRDWANFFGQLHGMLKAPVKRAEFTLSLEKRIEHAINNGVDVTDPLVQTRLATEALNDGYRTIFMQHGFSSDMFNQFVSQMEGSKRYPVAGEIGARTMRFLLPIVRVPANIVAETATGVHGVPTASARVMFHVARGTLRELPPEIADSIMRQFKKGSIGLGLMAIGYFAPQFAGGYDWREKRKPGSAKTAGFQIYGWDVPRWMAHAPWFELMQIGATVRHVKEQHVAKTGTDKGVGEGLWAAGLGLIEETPFVGQMLRVDKLFGRPDERTSYLGELGRGTVVPQAIQWAAQQLDKNAQGEVVKRKPENLWQQFEMGIPGLRKNVPVKKDKTANPFAQ